jgi:hypothetical protein
MSSRKRKLEPEIVNTRENLKNFLTHNYLKGFENVYKIKSPNGRHYLLVNRNSFTKLALGRNNTAVINQMVHKTRPFVARNKKTRRNESISYKGNNYNNYVPTSNYVFRAFNNTYGMRKVLTQYGPIKLTNVNHHKLPEKNLRILRSLRRQTTINNANFARQQAAKKAERLKYIYRIQWEYNHKVNHSVANANYKYIGRNIPGNATRANNHNTSHIMAKFRQSTFNLQGPYFNMNSVKIDAYRLKN